MYFKLSYLFSIFLNMICHCKSMLKPNPENLNFTLKVKLDYTDLDQSDHNEPSSKRGKKKVYYPLLLFYGSNIKINR